MNKPAMLLSILVLLSAQGCGSDRDRFVKACESATRASTTICTCVAGKATQELSPDGFALTLATLQGDTKSADEIRRSMTLPDVMKASLLLVSAPGQCALETTGE